VQEPELEFLKFEVPEFEEVEVYLVRTKDGKTLVRTKEELEEVKEKEVKEE